VSAGVPAAALTIHFSRIWARGARVYVTVMLECCSWISLARPLRYWSCSGERAAVHQSMCSSVVGGRALAVSAADLVLPAPPALQAASAGVVAAATSTVRRVVLIERTDRSSVAAEDSNAVCGHPKTLSGP